MKIVSVEAIPVTLPFHEPVSDSLGTFTCSNHGIVVIRGESGEYGIGEIALAWFGGAHALCREVNEYWSGGLAGEDIYNMTTLRGRLDQLAAFSKRHLLAKAGVEMALMDLLGKTVGLPVYNLLGGKMRESIPLTGGIAFDSVERMVETARRKVTEGYKELKLKVGLDERKDLEAVRQIRNAVPDAVRMRVDANMAWTDPKRAKALINEMAQYGVRIVEQPLPDDCIDEMAWLRTQTDALLLVDEGVWDVRDAKRYLDGDAADLLHVYITEAGGIHAAKSIFELAALYRKDCTIGSMPEGRIGASASAHVALAMPNLSGHASDIRGFQVYSGDVTLEDLDIADGELKLSDRPGLGVTLDFERLEKFRMK